MKTPPPFDLMGLLKRAGAEHRAKLCPDAAAWQAIADQCGKVLDSHKPGETPKEKAR